MGECLASTTRTQDEARNSGGMLPMVDNRSRIGLLTKNHLLLMLLVLLDERIHMDHDRSQSWKVPDKDGAKAHKEVFEVLEHGLMVVVFGKAIWKKSS